VEHVAALAPDSDSDSDSDYVALLGNWHSFHYYRLVADYQIAAPHVVALGMPCFVVVEE